MRLSPLISILIACVLGAATLVSVRYFNVTEPRPDPVSSTVLETAIETQPILVARTHIAAGAQIDADALQVVDLPANTLPPDGYPSFEALGLSATHPRHALVEIEANAPIQDSRLSPLGVKVSLSSRLQPGQRAYTLRMDDVRGVAGLVLPGDHVDVLHSYNIGAVVEAQQVTTKIALENIPILALDLNTDAATETPRLFKTATLAVTADQARTLSTISQTGRVSLALRSSQDKLATTSYAEKSIPKAAPITTPVATARPRRITKVAVQPKREFSDVEVILGDAVETVSVPLQ